MKQWRPALYFYVGLFVGPTMVPRIVCVMFRYVRFWNPHYSCKTVFILNLTPIYVLADRSIYLSSWHKNECTYSVDARTTPRMMGWAQLRTRTGQEVPVLCFGVSCGGAVRADRWHVSVHLRLHHVRDHRGDHRGGRPCHGQLCHRCCCHAGLPDRE